MEEVLSDSEPKDEENQKNNTNWFSRNAQVISSNVQNIKERTATIRRLLVHLQTSQNDNQSFQKLQEIQHNTTELARTTSRKIKRLNGTTKCQLITTIQTPVDKKEALKSEQIALTEEFSEAIKDLQSVQHLTSQMHQDVNQKYHRKKSNENVEGIPIDKVNLRLTVIRQKSFDKDDNSIRVLQDRQRAFEELEQDMSDLNYIYHEINKISKTNQNGLDQIEENVNVSSINIDRGAGVLVTAGNAKKQTRKTKLYLMYISILTVLLVGVIVMLIIFN